MPVAVGLDGVLAGDQATIEHLQGYIDADTAFDQLQQQPGMAYQSAFSRWITPFLYQQMSAGHTYAGGDYSARMVTLNRQLVQALHQAGAGLLLGTDAAQPYHIPGYAIHEELALLVEAGLSPYEALAAGTRNAALALHDSDQVGRVAEGLRADLLLLEANPPGRCCACPAALGCAVARPMDRAGANTGHIKRFGALTILSVRSSV